MTLDEVDPKGLMRESYRIEGITAGECRSIFLDWAINVAPGQDARPQMQAVLDHYSPENPDHPMTETLQQGLAPVERTGRRGGWRARSRPS